MIGNYNVHGPVRLADGRRAVFIMAAYHPGCCKEALVLLADGTLEIVNPDSLSSIAKAPASFDADWYTWHGKRRPIYGWARYRVLKEAYDAYAALPLDERLAMHDALTGRRPLTGPGHEYRFPYLDGKEGDPE